MEGHSMERFRFSLTLYNISSIFLCSVFFVFALAGPLLAQETGTLKGEVKDVDGVPMPGVNVIASGPGGTKNMYTDVEGKFALVGLAAGTYDITAELSGYVTITQTDIEIRAGDNTI